MTDYKEEQQNEIEALESIYPEEFTLTESNPYASFSIKVSSENYCEGDEEGGICLSLDVQYTPKYPDEPPVIELTPIENVEMEELSELQSALEEAIEENLGMVMVFTLASQCLEWSNTWVEERIRKQEEEEERKKKEAEEAERKRFEGTRVTVESFLVWKIKFDEEMRGGKDHHKEDEKSKRLNGKELFLKDTTLNESDLAFLADGDAEVKVDESLFQDLEDFDLEDDLANEDLADLSD